MFSIQRFEGSGEEAEGSRKALRGVGSGVDRIARINQRKAEAAASGEQNQASSSKVVLPSVEKASLAPASTSIPSIHPSRLAVSHVLRQSDKKAQSSFKGEGKEKTRAKQRYLKTKKERRKKKKKAAAESQPKGKKKDAENVEEGTMDVDADADADEGAHDESTTGLEGAEEREQPASVSSSSSSSSASSASSSRSESESGEEDEEEVEGRGAETEDASPAHATTAQEDVANERAPLPAQAEPTSLSRFPAPKRTLQASRKDLAAQGLPAGLAYPHLVDSSTTRSVKQSDHSDLDQISPAMKARLAKLGITQWFAVQTSVIPILLSHPLSKSLYPSPPLPDLCVSAPTGSGKTLSYAVPIVEILQRRVCKRLRALIVLPTRDLVNQVRDTMSQLCKGTPLSIAAISGQQSFEQEQKLLVDHYDGEEVDNRYYWLKAEKERGGGWQRHDGDRPEVRSKVDILIATPGRLVNHISQTVGFTLQHLRFLVIDEADRLLGQSFQEWLPRILDELDATNVDATEALHEKERLTPAWRMQRQMKLAESTLLQEPEQPAVQKLLFSATLTRDPAKMMALQLRNAAFVSVEDEGREEGEEGWGSGKGGYIDRQQSFALPGSLQEHMLVMKPDEKPLQLLHLLYNHQPPLRQVVCFTKSVENASRLVKLVECFQQARGMEEEGRLVVKEYSSELNGAQRNRILGAFKAGKVNMLVCSDVLARGIDLPDVRHVVSYDVPVDMAKYVHRVGRTARANREGHAWTLVEEQEARHFKTMMKRGGRRSKVDKIRVRPEQQDCLRDHYNHALSSLEALYSRNV